MAKKIENSQKSVSSNKELTLADLPIGSSATIVKIIPNARGGKKFADVGLVPGTELLMESHAPFGGLIRVKVMETSMALHSDDAKNIVMKKESKK
jgi:Fe2+ transport system protein FeoA